MQWIKEFLGLNKTKLDKLVEANQKLGRKIDAIREKRKLLQQAIKTELGE